MIHHMTAKNATKSTGKSAARDDWRHIGADVPPTMYDKIKAASAKDSVAQAVIIRWALADYFAVQAPQPEEADK